MQKWRHFCELVSPLFLKRKFATSHRFSKVLAAGLDAKLQTVSHAEHDPVAHFGCDGDKNLPDAVFRFTDVVIKLH